MLEKIKETIVDLISTLGYEISDNASCRDGFPYLQIRTSNCTEAYSQDINFQTIDFIVDIFSTYNGEKEILNIKSEITPLILQKCNMMPEVTFSELRTCKILDDKTTGPIRKHGVLVYRFRTVVQEVK